MNDWLTSPFLIFTAWTLLAVLFGMVIGRAIHDADERDAEPPWVPGDTEIIDWDKRTDAWL